MLRLASRRVSVLSSRLRLTPSRLSEGSAVPFFQPFRGSETLRWLSTSDPSTSSSPEVVVVSAASAAYFSGLDRVRAQDLPGAAELFKESLETDPGFVLAHIELGLQALVSDQLSGHDNNTTTSSSSTSTGESVAMEHLLAAHSGFSEFREDFPEFGSEEDEWGTQALSMIRSKGAAMHVGLAELYRKRGDTLKQAAHLEMALSLTPDNKPVRLALAEQAMRGKRYDDAIKQLEAVLEFDPSCSMTRSELKNVFLGKAMDRAEAADAHGAIACYQKVLDMIDEAAAPGEASDAASAGEAQRTEVLTVMGQMYEGLGDKKAATDSYRSAAESSAGHWRSRLALAKLLHRTIQTAKDPDGQLADAMSLYKEAIAIESCKEKDQAHYGLGMLWMMQQDGHRADEAFRNALTVNPELKEARLQLANVLVALGNVGGAIYQLETALETDPEYGPARANLRQIQAAQAKTESNKEEEGGGGGGDLASGAGDRDGVVVDSPSSSGDSGPVDVTQLDAATRDALTGAATAEMLGQRGDIAGALERYEAVMPKVEAAAEADPRLMEALAAAYTNEGALLQRAGRVDDAFQRFELAWHALIDHGRATTPDLPNNLFGALVNAYVMRNDASGAEELCQEAKSLSFMAGSPAPDFMLGTLRIFVNDLDGALRCYEDALAADPNHSITLFNIGNVYLRKHSTDGDPNHLDSAVASCEKALQADSSAIHAYLFMADAKFRQGNEAGGLKDLTEALKLNPDFPGAHSLMGAHLVSKERFKDAIPHLQRSVDSQEMNLPEIRVRDLTALTMAFMREGNPRAALESCTELCNLQPELKQYQDLKTYLQTLV